jgi:hypothetical protein
MESIECKCFGLLSNYPQKVVKNGYRKVQHQRGEGDIEIIERGFIHPSIICSLYSRL